MKVGFLGPRGTFSEEAAARYAETVEDNVSLVPMGDIPELLRAVARGDLDAAVVPIENSLEGTVPITVDMLIHEIDVPICGELVLPVRHNLLAPRPVPLEEIRCVISHPQALAQCRHWLETRLPHARRQTSTSTAEAAATAARGDGTTAAIGTGAAAQIYGLTILAEGIQDGEENVTRFIVVGHRRPEPTGWDKTSLAFSFPVDRAGILYQALGEFANRGINLTKLESRPARKALGRYLFLVDLEGHQDDPEVAASLEALRPRCALFKVLGSYPRAAWPASDVSP